MKVVVIGSIRWRIGIAIKEFGEKLGVESLTSLGKKIAWGCRCPRRRMWSNR